MQFLNACETFIISKSFISLLPLILVTRLQTPMQSLEYQEKYHSNFFWLFSFRCLSLGGRVHRHCTLERILRRCCYHCRCRLCSQSNTSIEQKHNYCVYNCFEFEICPVCDTYEIVVIQACHKLIRLCKCLLNTHRTHTQNSCSNCEYITYI